MKFGHRPCTIVHGLLLNFGATLKNLGIRSELAQTACTYILENKIKLGSLLSFLFCFQCQECHINIPHLFIVGSPLHVYDRILLSTLMAKPFL